MVLKCNNVNNDVIRCTKMEYLSIRRLRISSPNDRYALLMGFFHRKEKRGIFGIVFKDMETVPRMYFCGSVQGCLA